MRKYGRVTDARFEARRFDDEALDLCAVLALEVDVLHFAEPDAGEQLVVGVGESREGAIAGQEDLRRQVGLGDHGRGAAVAADIELAHPTRTADRLFERAPIHRHPSQVLLAVVLHYREHRPAVDRKLRVEDVAIEGRRQHRGLTALRRGHRQVVDRVDVGGGVCGGNMGDPFAVRRPSR